MSTLYTPAPEEILDLIEARKSEHYPELNEAGVTFSVLLVSKPGKESALVVGGYPALACVKAQSITVRAGGGADVLLLIDGPRWHKMTAEQKAALIDHQLHHVDVARDEDESDGFARDAQGRPKIKMKRHDWQFGWFIAIAQRHGLNSPEVTSARMLWDNDGQSFFPFLQEIPALT